VQTETVGDEQEARVDLRQQVGAAAATQAAWVAASAVGLSRSWQVLTVMWVPGLPPAVVEPGVLLWAGELLLQQC
jgi:hypothetical protein